jgi:hypothetical protein
MTEAADMAEAQGNTGYARAFREDAERASAILIGLQGQFELIAEEMQDEFADQG